MELADEDWLNHINVKVMGYVRCARETIPHMINRGGGRIINIGGMAARSVNSLANSNGVTNSAVSNIAKNLSDQVAKDGILVNCIHPGTTRTPRQDNVLERAWAAKPHLQVVLFWERRSFSGSAPRWRGPRP